MTVPIYREGDEVEVTRRGVIVVTDPKDPHRYGIGRPGRYGADAYFRTDDDEVSHRLVSSAERETAAAETTEKTLADELREAAARLRANPERPVDAPLAASLEKAAKDFDEQVISELGECPACGDGCYADHGTYLVHDGGCCGVLLEVGEDRCQCFALPLAVARVVNGAAS